MMAPLKPTPTELFHYTSIHGLQCILKEQRLRASHAKFLNDSTEIEAFAEVFTDLICPIVKSEIQRSTISPFQIDDVDEIVDSLSSSAFGALLGTKNNPAFLEPYIASFCTAPDEKVRLHGLLSQWRGYGKEGGYAIVFNAARLDQLLMQEGQRWGLFDLFSGDVVYSSPTKAETIETLKSEFETDLEQLDACIRKWVNGVQDAVKELYQPLIHMACRYKHWGFSEEREVRIIGAPGNSHVVKDLKEKHQLTVDEKSRDVFFRGGTSVPCIYLFDGIANRVDNPLPIERIIVGPHSRSFDRVRAVEIMVRQLGLEIEVSASDIPYIEHS
jgi:hypothetical protein